MTSERPGITRLKKFIKKHQLKVCKITDTHPHGDLILVDFYIGEQSWNIYISDDYKEFKDSRQLLAVFLALEALEDYRYAEDYLKWCSEYELDPATETMRAYYMQLKNTYNSIVDKLIDIDSCRVGICYRHPWRNKEDSNALLAFYINR